MEQLYRKIFAFDPELVYLNHAATGMLPRRSADAMKHYIEQYAARGKSSIEQIFEIQSEFRAQASRLLNVSPDEVAPVRNTSDGLALALQSIDWQSGDNMIVQQDAFPASLYVAEYGFPKIEKRYVPLNNGKNFYRRLSQHIDSRTRAIIVDFVHFLSGYRLDLHKLSELKNARDIYLIVDGIQGLGAVPVNLGDTAVDFFSAGGVKWLQGPAGTGIIFVRQQILAGLVPSHIGWASAEYEDLSSLYPIRPLINNARRFQPINDNYIGIIGLTKSLEILNEIGPGIIEHHILEITRTAMAALQSLDCEVLTPGDDDLRAGIISFKHRKKANKSLFERLQQNRIVCSFREGWIRLAFHFYNTEQELEKVIDVIESTDHFTDG